MTPKKAKKTPEDTPQPEGTTRFQVQFSEEARQDLREISDQATVEKIIRQGLKLEHEPLKQGKPLTGDLKGYRSVRAAGQRYRLIYSVAISEGQVLIVVIGIRMEGSKKDAYAVASKRLG